MFAVTGITVWAASLHAIYWLPGSNVRAVLRDPAKGESWRRIVAALRGALENARPGRIVCISTVGAQAEQESLLSQLRMLEQGLGSLALHITFLRPAWFMENAAWDVAPARETGVIQSFL